MAGWTRTASGSTRAPDLVEVRRALALLADPTAGIQLQAAPSWTYQTFDGHDLDGMTAWIEAHGDATGIYYALNPVPPDLRRHLRVGDVLRRRWLLVDVDRQKSPENKDLSATDEEKDQARQTAATALTFLQGRGWGEPVLVDSGNGYHLLYRVDLPNSDDARKLLRFTLLTLAERCGPTIDVACHDARRVAKLPGTWARKGPDTPDRPHRMARLIKVPNGS